jgi:hypothetical protein
MIHTVVCCDVGLLAFESNDVRRPRNMNSWLTNTYEKGVFLCRFFYLLLFTGFMPTIFDLLPFKTWQILTVFIYGYRLYILPFYLRFIGYGKFADWKNPPLGTHHPVVASSGPHSHKDDKVEPFGPQKSTDVYFTVDKRAQLTEFHALSQIDFGDADFEKFIMVLYRKGAHMSPHSQSPGNPFNHSNFPGNFLNHLVGVYKILVAWNQPQFICRAGLFHSVYGTFDYRTSHFFDLRDGRQALRDLIGPAAEEISFAICTSDRLLLMRDLREAMYGKEAAKAALQANSIFGSPAPVPLQNTDGSPNGNPHPPVLHTLSPCGFQLRNHITQEFHVLPPELFASFIVVFCADFMDQGAAGTGSHDYDICLFQFQRYRFFRDILTFVGPYLHCKPPVMCKYMELDSSAKHDATSFAEPSRDEVS